MSLPSRAKIVDVGPRDGLQNEKQPVPTPVEVEMMTLLNAGGLAGSSAVILIGVANTLPLTASSA